jgi:DKNYY family
MWQALPRIKSKAASFVLLVVTVTSEALRPVPILALVLLLSSGADFFLLAQKAKPERPNYTNDGQNVSFRGKIVQGADPKTFTLLGDEFAVYGKDSMHVYVGGKMIPDANPVTFTVISDHVVFYAKDSAHVFAGSVALAGADPKTFTLISTSYKPYGKDATHVYLQEKTIPGADPATFTLIGIRDYAKDSKHVFMGLLDLPNADPATFVVLQGGFAKDARQVYFGAFLFADADSQSFSITAFNDDAKNPTVFAKDKAHVFYQGGWASVLPSIIPGADPRTFVTLDHHGYGGGYARDAHTVYWGDTAVQDADPKTFQSMAPYGKDHRTVYLEGKQIAGADPATFVFVLDTSTGSGSGYAKDAHTVYYEWDRIPGADPATFAADTNSNTVDARDKNHTYLSGQLVN